MVAQILVRKDDERLVRRLKASAQRNGRSLQAEAKTILEQNAPLDMKSARRLVDAIRKGLGESALRRQLCIDPQRARAPVSSYVVDASGRQGKLSEAQWIIIRMRKYRRTHAAIVD